MATNTDNNDDTSDNDNSDGDNYSDDDDNNNDESDDNEAASVIRKRARQLAADLVTGKAKRFREAFENLGSYKFFHGPVLTSTDKSKHAMSSYGVKLTVS